MYFFRLIVSLLKIAFVIIAFPFVLSMLYGFRLTPCVNDAIDFVLDDYRPERWL